MRVCIVIRIKSHDDYTTEVLTAEFGKISQKLKENSRGAYVRTIYKSLELMQNIE
jgi:hypothetical protein